jgi:hypothetical protein
MSSSEFSEWLAFLSIEPLGEDRTDVQAGLICATIANANRDDKKKKKPFDAIDFIPDYWGDRLAEEQTKDHGLALLEKMKAFMPPIFSDAFSHEEEPTEGGDPSVL